MSLAYMKTLHFDESKNFRNCIRGSSSTCLPIGHILSVAIIINYLHGKLIAFPPNNESVHLPVVTQHNSDWLYIEGYSLLHIPP